MQSAPDGLRLWVRVQPKAARASLGGVRTGADGRTRILAKVRAAPDKGAANAELCALIAKRLGTPRSAVSVVAGQASREKTVLIAGAASDCRLDAVAAMLQEPAP